MVVQVQGSNEVARFTRELKAIKARGSTQTADGSLIESNEQPKTATSLRSPKSRLVPSGAKEIRDRYTVLSERAVLTRVHRINAGTSEHSAGTKTNCANCAAEQETPNEAKKTVRRIFFLSPSRDLRLGS